MTLETTRRCLTALLLALVLSLPATAASERWYVVSLAGQPVGSIQESVSEEGGGPRTQTQMRMVLNRLGSKVEMETSSDVQESVEGRFRRAGTDLRMSAQSTSTLAEAEEGVVRIRSQAGGQSFDRTAAFSGELLGPEGIRRLTQARLVKPDDSFETQIFSPELAAVATVARKAVGTETISSEGRDVQALRVEEQVSGYPGKRVLWLDTEGRLLASEETGPFGALRTFRADALTAQRIGQEGGELPGEVYTNTIVRTQVRLPEARRTEWLKLRLLHRNPDLGWPDFDRPGQTVVEKTDRSLVLEVSRPRPIYGLTFPVTIAGANRASLAEYLEPNAYVQSSDPELRAKALEIVGDEKDLFRAALKLERWVAESMNMDLGIAVAPSVEILKNRRGTCVAYSTLLATLVRAVGIPSRMVLGYVYVDGMFGGHAWVEILAGEQWLPLDAAIVAAGTADAARFAFVTSSLKEGPALLSTGPSLQLFGQIDARVLGYALEGGERVAVAEDAKPYTVTGDVYRNTGLGIELRKPEGFRFVDLDGVWPEDTLVGMAGAHGEKVLLESHRRLPWEDAEAAAWRRLEPQGDRGRIEVAGRPGYLVESEGHAAVAIPGSEGVWVLRAEGPDAAGLVRRVAAGLRM